MTIKFKSGNELTLNSDAQKGAIKLFDKFIQMKQYDCMRDTDGVGSGAIVFTDQKCSIDYITAEESQKGE